MTTQPCGPMIAGLPTQTSDEQQLCHDIAYFEQRLSEMGSGGDCAYERALADAFRVILDQRKRLLSGLTRRP